METETPLKRKRGRPRKSLTTEAADSESSSPDNVLIKRKRGRPCMNRDAEMEDLSSTLKRKRGRPPKSRRSSSSSSSDCASPQEKKIIKKPWYLVKDETPNEYTIPSTDVAFSKKFMSVSPFKLRGRKPGSTNSVKLENEEEDDFDT